MSAATLAMAIEGVLLALALVFIAALLRSHAEILRRLAALEGSSEPGLGAHPPDAIASSAPDRAPGAVVGQNLAGDAVSLSLAPGAPRTLVAFLSSGCVACRSLWSELREAPPALPAGTRLVILTKGPDRESPSALRAVSGRTEVVMSSSAWDAFAVPATPHFALVDGGSGAILGRGSATGWSQIISLVADAEADADAVAAGADGEPAAPRAGGSARRGGSSARALRAEQTLARAGITAEHPSLYPSRRSPS